MMNLKEYLTNVSLGTNLNICIRSQEKLNNDMQEQVDLINGIMAKNRLKHGLIVHRGQVSLEYERKIAESSGYTFDYLLYNAYVYTSLIPCTQYNGTAQLNIHIPAGSHYLYMGKMSHESTIGELMLPIGTLMKINDRKHNNLSLLEKLTYTMKKINVPQVTYIDATVCGISNFSFCDRL